MKTPIVLVVAALGAWGCDPKNTTGVYPGISSSCAVTLSGPVAGTFDCRPATTEWSSVDSMGAFSFGVVSTRPSPDIAVTITWRGEPQVRSYANTDSLAEAQLLVTDSAGHSWRAAVGGTLAAAGSYSLVFTKVVGNLVAQNGNGYSTEGSLTASLPALASSGATSTITLTATF